MVNNWLRQENENYGMISVAYGNNCLLIPLDLADICLLGMLSVMLRPSSKHQSTVIGRTWDKYREHGLHDAVFSRVFPTAHFAECRIGSLTYSTGPQSTLGYLAVTFRIPHFYPFLRFYRELAIMWINVRQLFLLKKVKVYILFETSANTPE